MKLLSFFVDTIDRKKYSSEGENWSRDTQALPFLASQLSGYASNAIEFNILTST